MTNEEALQNLEKFKSFIKSKNSSSIFRALNNIASGTSDEELLDKVLNITQQALTTSSSNTTYTQTEAVHVLAILINKNPQKYAQSVLNDLFLTNSIFSEDQKYYLLSRCMKYEDISLEDLSDEQKQMCTKSKKLRFSTYEECKYIMDNQISWDLAPRQAGIRSYLIGQLPENEKNNNWLVPGSFKLAQIFKTGREYKTYIDQMQRYDISVHDALYWLPDVLDDTLADSFKDFLLKNVITRQNAESHRPKLKDLIIIANSWSELTSEEQQLSIKELVKICSAKQYKDAKYPNFALECSKNELSINFYKQAESIYKASLEVPEPFDSTLIFESGAYKGRFLPRADPRVGFFGHYTDCCQKFCASGHDCTVSSMIDPYSQLFVIENNKGEIIAGSWVWQNTESGYKEVCFDNIEGLIGYFQSSNPNSDTANKKSFKDIYEQTSQYLITEGKCKKVTIGIKCGRFEGIFDGKKETELIPLPKHYGNKYSDATNQSLLAENPNAPQCDTTQEKCFIRNDFLSIFEEIPIEENETLLVINPSGFEIGRSQIKEYETKIEFSPEYTPEKEIISQLFERIHKINQDHSSINITGNKQTIKNILRIQQKFNSKGYKKVKKGGKTAYQITLYLPQNNRDTPIQPTLVAIQKKQSNCPRSRQ